MFRVWSTRLGRLSYSSLYEWNDVQNTFDLFPRRPDEYIIYEA